MKKLSFVDRVTPIEYLKDLSEELKVDLYVKREDYTGIEISGNKIRKLEYSLAEAKEKNADAIITTGGPQSNHCRITAAICRKLDLDCHIIHSESGQEEGNYFFTEFLGAKRHFVKDEDFDTTLKKLIKELKIEGKTPYFIPTGASNAIGSLGYLDVYREILRQEQNLKLKFDKIIVTVGSGGTTAGLVAGSLLEDNKSIIAYSIWQEKDAIKEIIEEILKDMEIKFTEDELNNHLEIREAFGQGYSVSTKDEISFIEDFARKTGIILDPTYTGKAMKGLVEDIKSGEMKDEKILFIHTGGIFGWRQDQRDLLKED